MAELFNPAITAISQPLYRMGQTAMEAVFARIANPTLGGESIKFETTLIVRTSSALRFRWKPIMEANAAQIPTYTVNSAIVACTTVVLTLILAGRLIIMKFASYTTVFSDLSLEQVAGWAKEAEFDGVEIDFGLTEE